jgi:hypothetical protein
MRNIYPLFSLGEVKADFDNFDVKMGKTSSYMILQNIFFTSIVLKIFFNIR